MRKLRSAIGLAAAILVALAAVCVTRALSVRSRQVAVEPATPLAIDGQAAANHLARAIAFATVSRPDQPPHGAPLEGLLAHLAASYPRVHATLQREAIGEHATLYTLAGSDPQRAPLLLLAHLDVVPVEPGTETTWSYPPFAGALEDGFVWGRGAMDDKGAATAILEATELLLAGGYRPRRTVLFALGADEEIGGRRGATAIATRLAARGVKPLLVLDEGTAITAGILTVVRQPVALVSIAEKGYLSLELLARSEGGHSSMPPPQTSVGILAAAIDRLERSQMPASLEGPVGLLIDHLQPEVGFATRLALANRWLFAPLLVRSLASTPAGNGSVRTTTAPTMFEGSVKDNILPAQARAVVNFRIRPGDSIDAVMRHVRETVADPRVELRMMEETRSNPSRLSSVTGQAYRLLARTIRQRFPDVLVAPGLMLGATDSRHYAALGADTYRFSPFRYTAADLARIHGRDERIAIAQLADAVGFYAQLLLNADALD